MAAATFLAGVLSTSLVLGATTIALVLRLDLSLWSVLILQNSALAVAAVASVGFLHGIEHAGRGGVAPVRQFIRTGPLLLATQLLALLVTQSDIWILGLVATPEDIAPYGVAARLAQLVSLPHLVLNGVLPPLMAARVRDRQHGPLERVIRLSVAAATVPAVGLALLFFAWGEGILAVSFGSIYRDAAPILAVLAAANVVNVVCGPCSQLLIMSGHQRTLNLITLVNCVFCLGAGTLAALHVGALGVASVYALGLTMQGIAGAWAAERLVGIKTYAGPMALGDAVAAVQRTIRDAR
jgi:O-antigen/teichoic acid export membrane protein